MPPNAFLVALLLCILKCTDHALAICIASNSTTAGHGARLQCSNATLQTIFAQKINAVAAIMISNSDLGTVTRRAFAGYAAHLQSLNIHNCQINEIHEEAFAGLTALKKLALPNNNLTRVKEVWFRDLVYLEQLDLSFNRITEIEPIVFSRMPLLKRLDIRENRIACLDTAALPGGIDKVYLASNPLTFLCRGKITLWMRDHGVIYRSGTSEKEAWLDRLLWHCAMSDPRITRSERLMKECVLLNVFNQLRTGLNTAESYPLTVNCSSERNNLTRCIAHEAHGFLDSLTNGNVISKLLLYLHQAKSAN